MTRMVGDDYNASGSPNEASAQSISKWSAAGYNARGSINDADGWRLTTMPEARPMKRPHNR